MHDQISRPTAPVSSGHVAGYVVVIVAVLAGFYVLYLIHSILFLFLVAILLAMAIEPLVFRLRRGPFSRGQGILIVYTGIMLLIAGLWMLIVPVVLQEARTFHETFPRLLVNVQQIIYSIDDESLGRAAGIGLGIVEALFWQRLRFLRPSRVPAILPRWPVWSASCSARCYWEGPRN